MKRLPRYMIMRLLLAMLCLGGTHAFLDRAFTKNVQGVVLRAGEAAGCEIMKISGFMLTGPGGPFRGESSAIWNAFYNYAPTFVNAILSGLIALAAYAFASGPLGRTRLFGYRGQTRCGGCNYNLANLKSDRCPECGKVLAISSEGSTGL